MVQKLNPMIMPWATDWGALFGSVKPLVLEIGFGRGHMLLYMARTRPDVNIIGLEISNRCLLMVESAIEREQLTNARVIHATAETALYHLFEPATVSEVHINFPDPWFKTRHSHRRLMQRDTLDLIVNRMVAGGRLFLATDIHEYAAMSDALLSATPGLTNVLPSGWVHELAGRVTTKYEATAIREGRRCYYFVYQRNEQPAPFIPAVKEYAMPHLVFSSPATLDDVQAQFAPRDLTDGDTVIKIIACFRGQHALLFEVYVKEPTIDQRFAVMLNQHLDGTYTLMLGTIGHPRPTPGVHKVVAALGRWLLALHPDAVVHTQGVLMEDE